ncbi:30S ribosomal protein S2 [uncultured archaeon]|nr:30S ribosomal protein S2 [uncultured archaeon]
MAQEGFLIKQEKYLEAGIHIGTKLRVIDMNKFIYRTRNDGLYVLDLRKIDERIRMAGKLMAKYEPESIVVVASRAYSSMAAQAFGRITGAKIIAGRFVPGAFTNVQRADFVEPKLVVICDPKGERQAVLECGKMGLPSVGLCDTDNYTMYIDWVIPCNNKGRRSLALIFWLLAREMAIAQGKISSYDDFKPTLEEFEISLTAPPAEAAPAADAALGAEEPAEMAESAPEEPAEPSDEEEGEEPAKEDAATEAKAKPAHKKEGEEKAEKKPARPRAKKAAPKKEEGEAKPAHEAKEEKKAE